MRVHRCTAPDPRAGHPVSGMPALVFPVRLALRPVAGCSNRRPAAATLFSSHTLSPYHKQPAPFPRKMLNDCKSKTPHARTGFLNGRTKWHLRMEQHPSPSRHSSHTHVDACSGGQPRMIWLLELPLFCAAALLACWRQLQRCANLRGEREVRLGEVEGEGRGGGWGRGGCRRLRRGWGAPCEEDVVCLVGDGQLEVGDAVVRGQRGQIGGRHSAQRVQALNVGHVLQLACTRAPRRWTVQA